MDDGVCDLSLSGNASNGAFHNLTSYCEGNSSSFIPYPSTFFVQLVRLTVSTCVLILLLAMYNTLSVMNRRLLSTATCSLYWVVMCIAITMKSAVLIAFPLAAGLKESDGIVFNRIGFILQAVLQSVAVLFLFVALDHERRFRSSDFATVDAPAKHCVALSCRLSMLCSWPRLLSIALSAFPVLILVAIEAVYTAHSHRSYESSHLPSPLLWAYIGSLPLTRLACLLVGVALVRSRQGKLSPTIPAKVYLLCGLLLSLMEDFPNFVTACNKYRSCQLHHMTVFDLLQLVGILSLFFFLLFVRSQYLRVEQESKLNLVWDLQKLLQVNGRKDIVRRYTEESAS